MLPSLQNVLKCDTGGDWTEKAPQERRVAGAGEGEGEAGRQGRQRVVAASLLMGLLNDVDGLR